jgi:hypothetical protein
VRRRFTGRGFALAVVVAAALVSAAVAAASSWTMGNAAVDRANLDTFVNFTVVDQTNPADADGLLDQITYYVRLLAPGSNQSGVALVVVRKTAPCPGTTCSFRVVWISNNLANPATSGVYTFTPATPIPIKAGDNLALYFPGRGIVPYTLLAAEDPRLWEFWEPNNSGKPVVGEQLTISDPAAVSPTQHRRQYSVEGWTTDCTFSIGQPVENDGSSVFKAGRGVIPLKLIPSCGNGSLAPKITITYSGAGDEVVNEAVKSVSAADSGSTMRWDASAGQYIYNLDTRAKTAGAYRISVKVSEIEVLAVDFKLR